MISSIRIVSVLLEFFSRNENEFSILPPPCVDVAVKVFYFGRVTVCVIAAAGGRVAGHVPF